MSFDFHLVSTFFFSQHQRISQLYLELNGTELDKERRRNESEERWKERKEREERKEEISLRDFVPDESKYQLPMSKFTRLLVR